MLGAMQAVTLISIGAGGFLGACARYLFGAWVVSRLGGGSPVGTLAVNFAGSLLLALFPGLVNTAERPRATDAPARERRFLRRLHDLLNLCFRERHAGP